jgi:hypothetical protein
MGRGRSFQAADPLPRAALPQGAHGPFSAVGADPAIDLTHCGSVPSRGFGSIRGCQRPAMTEQDFPALSGQAGSRWASLAGW